MSESDIIDRLGGTGKVARMLDIDPSAVSLWRSRGIPAYRKQTLALMFPKICPPEWKPDRKGKKK